MLLLSAGLDTFESSVEEIMKWLCRSNNRLWSVQRAYATIFPKLHDMKLVY